MAGRLCCAYYRFQGCAAAEICLCRRATSRRSASSQHAVGVARLLLYKTSRLCGNANIGFFADTIKPGSDGIRDVPVGVMADQRGIYRHIHGRPRHFLISCSSRHRDALELIKSCHAMLICGDAASSDLLFALVYTRLMRQYQCEALR